MRLDEFRRNNPINLKEPTRVYLARLIDLPHKYVHFDLSTNNCKKIGLRNIMTNYDP